MTVDLISSSLRASLRQRLRERLEDLKLSRRQAGDAMGFNRSQMCRLLADEDVFSLDRLADAAGALSLNVRITATRSWEKAGQG